MVIPASVKEIEVGAFCWCSYLRTVTFKKGSDLETGEENASRGCKSSPEGLKSIDGQAFSHCYRLKHIQLPSRLQRIRGGCFSQSGLCEIIFPESAREVGAEAFYRCEYLRSVQLNEGLQKLGAKEVVNGRECEGEVFLGSALESIRLPSTLKRIEYRTFSCCGNLRSIEIPSGVECIGEKCFTDSRI